MVAYRTSGIAMIAASVCAHISARLCSDLALSLSLMSACTRREGGWDGAGAGGQREGGRWR